MVYKTLHWYIFKELMRIFILTASALTTLMAFGGTFKPLTKQGLDVFELLKIIMNLMPAMLAYAIPMAALYAAVLVYWRMSTDNEILACRAGGISFGTIVLPAMVLGVVISLTDFMFVNFVVPVFLQKVERLVQQDFGSVLAFNISHQEPFKFADKIIYADSAQIIHPKTAVPGETVVLLNGVAATPLNRNGKPSAIIMARQAYVHFLEMPKGDVEAWVQVVDGAAFHPVTLEKVGGSVDRLPPDHAYLIPSQTQAQPKFAKLDELGILERNPDQNSEIADVLDRMSRSYRFQQIAKNYAATYGGKAHDIRFDETPGDYIIIHEQGVSLSAEQELSFLGAAGWPVQVDQYRAGKRYTTFRCDSATLHLSDEDYPTPHVAGMLELHGSPVMRHDWALEVPETAATGLVVLQPLVIDPVMMVPLSAMTPAMMESLSAMGEFTPAVTGMMRDAQQRINELLRLIKSEKQSRGSFSISCLTLVLLGAALGILLRRRNPLAVFVVGFVPAIILVLLITAGRRMVEWNEANATQGYMVIWAGNVILLVMVTVVYAKLLRH